jgi:hypothetical protein
LLWRIPALLRRIPAALLRWIASLLAWRRTTVLPLRWLTSILLWRRSSVLLLLLAVLTGRWTTVAALRWHSTASAHALLLVLRIVARINSTENELDHPEIRCEIDRWMGLSHLGGFVLVV